MTDFIEQPLMDRGQFEVPLLYLIQQMKGYKLQIPHFQRSLVWNKQKQHDWFDTVIGGDAIGVIVTYQLEYPEVGQHYPVYIADGYQRIMSTINVLDNPKKYDFNVSVEKLNSYVERFRVVQQHRVYSSHDSAYKAFQNINRGTSISPAEYYKGLLTYSQDGRHVYESVYNTLRTHSALVSRFKKSVNRATESKEQRTALALFYLYVSNSVGVSLWKVGKSAIDVGDDAPIEKRISDWLQNCGDVSKILEDYSQYIAQQTSLIRFCLDSVNGDGSAITFGFYSCLIALGIWKKNNNFSVDWYKIALEKLIKASPMGSTSLHDIEGNRAPLSVQDIGHTLHILRKYGIEIPKKRDRKPQTVIGYDNSHYRSFNKYGEGDTFIEPAPLNRSRGEKNVF